MAKPALKLVIYMMCWSDKKEGLCGNILNRCTTLHANKPLKKQQQKKTPKQNGKKPKQNQNQKTNTENHHTTPTATSFSVCMFLKGA